MHTFQNRQVVNHCAEKMFELVADVESYPKFVPLCQSLDIKGRKDELDGTVAMIADMTVAYKFLSETFTSRIKLNSGNLSIQTDCLEGPFRDLENKWQFTPISEDQCEVFFYIRYEFKSRILGAVMGSMFDKAFRRFSHAFSLRANDIYGELNPNQNSEC